MNAIVTLTIGPEFEAMARLTHPNLKGYTDRIGAEFFVINTRKYPEAHECYEKLQSRDLLEKYDRIIYLDTDVLVTPKCPSLFDVVPYGTFGAFAEGNHLDNGKHALTEAIFQFGVNLTARYKEFFNAGVLVFDKTHRDVFTPPAVFHNNFFDNTWVCLQMMRHAEKFQDLGPDFNCMASMDWDHRLDKNIIHYAGGGVKGQIATDLQNLR